MSAVIAIQPSTEHGASLTARSISTPIKGSTRLRWDMAGPAARELLEAGRFDQAPVVDEGGRVIGWVHRSRLTRRVGQVEDAMIPLSSTAIVAEEAPISEVVELLAASGFVYVVGLGRIVGFISPSDLDRHASRGHFYLLVSRVEMLLAQHVGDGFDEVALRRRITGQARMRYEAATRRQQEVTAVEYLDLATLMALHQESESFQALDEPARSVWRKAMADVRGVRNAIMHPNAPLTGRNSARLRDAQRSAWFLIEALR